MMLKLVLHLAFAATLAWTAQAGNDKLVLCYYGSWATYRHGNGKFDVANIDPHLCTHVIYTFVGLSDDSTVRSLDPWLDLPDNWGRDNFGKFIELRHLNPDLKLILAIGGWNEGSGSYSRMANNPASRKVFVQSATQTILKYGFDGLDLDWEYPNRRDTVFGQADVNNFVLLLQELREAFDVHGLFLTAAVASVSEMAKLSYDIPAISKSLDLISLMTYDMHGAWDPVTGHNSPLHKSEGDDTVAREDAYTLDVALEYWLNQGCPPEKILVGVPLYGRTFTLADPNNSGVRAPATGAGIAGPYTAQAGVIGYNEFCNVLSRENWDIRYDSLAKVPYAVKYRDWVTYDDVDSINIKVNFALEKGVAGIMVWSIETDDFQGLCHGESYPLLKGINRALGRSWEGSLPEYNSTTSSTTTSTSTTPGTNTSTSATTTTPTPPTSSTHASTTNTPTTSTSNPSHRDICQEEGYAKDPYDCSSFYMCTRDESGKLHPHHFTCPVSLVWHHEAHVCDYPENVDCDDVYLYK